ncbi:MULTISPECIES: SGNH/GDSL hydrolase family protein [unclassified Arthrobacter]|uniref:SGNH/GDSL hydrolase family protein n=1 Tax=unclassified Arthrobacter TaxID=235627 RepID=UPI001E3CC152|nr:MULTISPECIES: SGNH/GDSL hydrolase family protein [unclassified Arthrobacter]MCC9144760.1 SGNH/GDSL hydrolase family protein [Arthrobacter sp. zg-Y919]MDK1275986.1 SGNH/GDSL hydrolase family protein [Arthrobacter sp. zg.Y919]WIB02665.1 SGNH/GDSL hydrolase family protein [Arthrobacter sp. zg-Y919]
MSPIPALSRRLAVLVLGSAAFLAGGAAPAAAVGQGSESRGGHSAEHRGGNGHGNGHGNGSGRGNSGVDYVAFGDSYASGYGGGPVLDACGRTAQGYPALLDAQNRVELDGDVTCAGATALTTPPAAPAGPVDLPEQIDDAEARGLLTKQTDAVTVTIGGNDVRFGSVVAACAGAQLPATCAPAIEQTAAYARNVLAPELAEQFARITELAPKATLVVTGYPYLFEAGTPGPLSAQAQALFNEGTDALNAVLEEQVPRGGVFVDVVDEFAGHGVGSTDSWILFEGGQFDLHPTETGYREGYTAAILEDAGRAFGADCRGGNRR